MTDREKVLQVLNKRHCRGWDCSQCPLGVGTGHCKSKIRWLTDEHIDDLSISDCNQWLSDNPEQLPDQCIQESVLQVAKDYAKEWLSYNSEQIPEPGFQEDTRKSDKGKTKYQFLMRDLAVQVDGMCKILTRGAERYGSNSWQQSTKHLAYLDACYRHIAAWNKGERLDSDSGQSHLLHAAINLMFLDWFDEKGK